MIQKILAKDTEIDPEQIKPDLSENFRSLKTSVFKEVFIRSCSANDIEKAMYLNFEKNLMGNNCYKDNLGIFERPLLKAGLKKYGSQMKLANILGINRNTLRKKIYEYNIR
jgi:DNA-binding protein Fis